MAHLSDHDLKQMDEAWQGRQPEPMVRLLLKRTLDDLRILMSLIQSTKLNGHDPYAYIKDVLTRLPTQKNSHIEELLPHRWQPQNP